MFLSHYVYNTLQVIIEHNSEVIVNIDDFDSEEENTETEDEVEELDEYLFDENSKITSLIVSSEVSHPIKGLVAESLV